MEEFTIQGGADYLSLSINRVDGFPDTPNDWGGYYIEIGVKIKSGGFSAQGSIWDTTGQLCELFQSLKNCNETLEGEVSYRSFEEDLEFKIQYDSLGHAIVTGTLTEHSRANELNFEISSDQTYLRQTVIQLGHIAGKYGDRFGIKK